MVVALLAMAMPSETWHPLYSDTFRANPTGPPNHRAVLSWYGASDEGKAFGNRGPGVTMLDLYELPGDGAKTLVTSTKVAEGAVVSSFSSHLYVPYQDFEDENGVFHHSWTYAFLAATLTWGQHDRTLIWYFDWHTMRPVEVLDVMYGDVTRLGDGFVMEHSPANYVHPGSWPRGVTEGSTLLAREWKHDPNQIGRFVPGAWRKSAVK